MSATQPVDNEALTARVVADALATERQQLVDAVLPSSPGGYCLFVGQDAEDDGDPLSLLGPYTLGELPIYVGAAAALRARARRYRAATSLGGAEGFVLERVYIAVLPTRTVAGALLIEGLLIEALRPPFNDPQLSGLGSRMQGHARVAAQRSSKWDALFRRPWAGPASAAAIATTRLALASRVVAPKPEQPRWSSLPRLAASILADSSQSDRRLMPVQRPRHPTGRSRQAAAAFKVGQARSSS